MLKKTTDYQTLRALLHLQNTEHVMRNDAEIKRVVGFVTYNNLHKIDIVFATAAGAIQSAFS
jgi:hypothetical protein